MNPKQRSRGRGNNGGNPNRSNYSSGGHGGGGGGGGGPRHISNVRTQVFDSNGPEGRIRGNAHQVMEKYLTLARDASSQGDRVAAENFYQHAEHYFRLINAYNQNNGQRRPQNLPTPAEDQNDMTGDDGEGDEQSSASAESEAYNDESGASQDQPMEGVEQPERPQRAERAPRGERPPREPRGERPPREPREPRAERPERAERPVRAEQSEQPEHGEQPQRVERAEGAERPERAPRRRAPRQVAQPPAEPDEGSAPETVTA